MESRVLFTFLLLCLVFPSTGWSQVDDRPVISVPTFNVSNEYDRDFAVIITKKVKDILVNSQRFNVVDTDNMNLIKESHKIQRGEEFIDSENLVDQNKAVAAKYNLNGVISKTGIVWLKNPDGSKSGCKAVVTINLTITDLETTISSEAVTFSSDVSIKSISPSIAIESAMSTLNDKITSYFKTAFPINAKILKVMPKNILLINVGDKHGVEKNMRFSVEVVEIIENNPFYTKIGELKVEKISGPTFSECSITKGKDEIISRFSNADKIACKQILK